MLLSTTKWIETSPTIVSVGVDEGVSFWNRYYLERYHKMSIRLKLFQDLNKQIFSHVVSNPGAIALELGCGSGRGVAQIVDALEIKKGSGKLYAIDFSYEALVLANENLGDPLNVFFKKDNIRQLSFQTGMFDVLFDIFAGTYMPHKGWRLGIAEAMRVLKPGGTGHFLYFKHNSNFGKCFRSQVLVELLLHPVGLFWALHLKKIKGLNLLDKFIERGEIVYPEPEEIVALIEQNGGRVKIAEDAFLKACIFIKATKK